MNVQSLTTNPRIQIGNELPNTDKKEQNHKKYDKE